MGTVLGGLGVLGVLVAALVAARIGAFVATVLHQPQVVGEVAAGLLCGPAAVLVLGADRVGAFVHSDVLGDVELVAGIGLVLFLMGEIRQLAAHHGGSSDRRSTLLVAAGALSLPAACGLLLAWWTSGDPVLRGDASAPAFWLMVPVCLAITAVPVLARITAERPAGPVGRTALAAAVVIDAVTWLALVAAIGVAAGGSGNWVRALLVLAGAVVVAMGLGALLRSGVARRGARSLPRCSALVLGVLAVVLALGLEHLGLTLVVGAVLAGLAVPGGPDWARPAALLARAGRVLVPTYFVVTGLTVLTGDLVVPAVSVLAGAVALAAVGKLAGGYLGARAARMTRTDAVRVGAMMNTRGLTEIVVVQAGYAAGVLTAPMMLTMLVMALATTAMTGPLLRLVDRRAPDPVPDRILEGERT